MVFRSRAHGKGLHIDASAAAASRSSRSSFSVAGCPTRHASGAFCHRIAIYLRAHARATRSVQALDLARSSLSVAKDALVLSARWEKKERH